jgi:DNA polymerase III subunit delta'
MLTGHHLQRESFMAALRSGRMHHAWLLTGPAAIGKRAFADAAALRLLAGGADDFAGGFDVPADHPVARLIGAGSHMDWRVLAREAGDTGKLRSGIVIEQVRALAPVFQGMPALGDWRAVIIDAMEDMNVATANALLKMLEEPPARTLFLCISHAPALLMATLRSRCRQLRFQPLDDSDTATVIARHLPDAGADERAALVRAAAGRPGIALGFAGLDIAGLETALARLAGRSDPAAAAKFARGFSAQASIPRFEALCVRAVAHAAMLAAAVPSPHNLDLYGQIQDLAGAAGPLQLERVQAATAIAGLLGHFHTLSQNAA